MVTNKGLSLEMLRMPFYEKWLLEQTKLGPKSPLSINVKKSASTTNNLPNYS